MTPATPSAHPAGDIAVDLLNFIRFSVAFQNRHHGSGGARTPGDSDQAPPGLLSASVLPQPLPGPLVLTRPPTADRWRASHWTFWRPGSGSKTDAAAVGRLGGSQVGVRLDLDLMPDATGLATAYTRLTSALQRPAAPEAAVGIAFQPVRAIPVSLAVERRVALGKGARDANAVMIVGGFGPVPIVPAVAAEGYAQAGMVGFRSRDLFVDGKLSLLAPVARSPLRVGASLSGGAQPQVERLDIGPELQVRLPLPRIAARIGAEWRERVAGRAAPASGFALTLAADF